MTEDTKLKLETHATIEALMRENRELICRIGDLEQQNRELREAVDALLQPAPSELLEKNRAHPSRQ